MQFSVEDGHIGFDWLLLRDENIRDRSRYEHFAASLGYKVVSKKENGVEYLRAVEGDLPRLCEGVLRELYGKNENSTIGLLVPQGVPWPH